MRTLFIYAVEGHPEHAEVLEVLFGLLGSR